MNHRGLQRALFRMQHDPEFAARLRAGEAGAVASTALGPQELVWLRAADPAGVAADRDGARAARLLRNVASEFRLCAALGPGGDGRDAWLAGFPRSPHFHAAIARDASLPLAFAAWLEDPAVGAREARFRAFAALEAAMARARRAVRDVPVPAAGEVVLSGAAQLLEVPAGTHAAAAALTVWLTRAPAQRGRRPRLAPLARGSETLLLVSDLAADARFGRLRPLRVEPLPASVAAFLRLAGTPQDAPARAAFAAAHAIDTTELEAVVGDYVAEGVLTRGA